VLQFPGGAPQLPTCQPRQPWFPFFRFVLTDASTTDSLGR
jgi:hypothetical protein